jgi:hypothetical protein
MKKRPISITILASGYLVVGTVGFAVHFRAILARQAFQYADALTELTELIAIVCGVFMLQGRNWARWLALAWIAVHVAISFFSSPHFFSAMQKVAIHGLFLALIAYFLFRPNARSYFQHQEVVGS